MQVREEEMEMDEESWLLLWVGGVLLAICLLGYYAWEMWTVFHPEPHKTYYTRQNGRLVTPSPPRHRQHQD